MQAITAPDKRLVLEESNLARWLWQLLRPHVQLVVCDARHNKLISAHPNKKDAPGCFLRTLLIQIQNFHNPVLMSCFPWITLSIVSRLK